MYARSLTRRHAAGFAPQNLVRSPPATDESRKLPLKGMLLIEQKSEVSLYAGLLRYARNDENGALRGVPAGWGRRKALL